LTGESATEEVDGLEVVGSDGADVVIAGDIWPVLAEDGLTEGLSLHKPSCSHAGALEPEVKAADA
jgi:hypothetical protein